MWKSGQGEGRQVRKKCQPREDLLLTSHSGGPDFLPVPQRLLMFWSHGSFKIYDTINPLLRKKKKNHRNGVYKHCEVQKLLGLQVKILLQAKDPFLVYKNSWKYTQQEGRNVIQFVFQNKNSANFVVNGLEASETNVRMSN